MKTITRQQAEAFARSKGYEPLHPARPCGDGWAVQYTGSDGKTHAIGVADDGWGIRLLDTIYLAGAGCTQL